jgi:hypothetical protein
MTSQPVRLKLSRKKGFRLQVHSRAVNGLPAVKVDRSTSLGNPYRVGDPMPGIPEVKLEADDCCMLFQLHTLPQIAPAELDELRGKNIACWCPLDAPWCHGDVLLKAANVPRRGQRP